MPLLDGSREEAWIWLGASWLLAVVWTNLAWLFAPWAERDGPLGASASLPESIVYQLANWRFASRLYQGLRVLYFLGLPFAALFWGQDALVARHLGLKPLGLPGEAGPAGVGSLATSWSGWLNDLGWTAALGAGTLALLLLSGFTYRRALQGEAGRLAGETWGWKTVREAVYQEIHWAFYRNAPIVAFGTYWGIWGGLALVSLEAALNPAWRGDLNEPSRVWGRLLQAALAVVSGVVFLHTHNLWLLLFLHVGLVWTVEAAFAGRLPVPAGTGPTNPQTPACRQD